MFTLQPNYNVSLLTATVFNLYSQCTQCSVLPVLEKPVYFASGLVRACEHRQAEGPSQITVDGVLCGRCAQDSFVRPGMHSLAVILTAWFWVSGPGCVSIQPVCHVYRGWQTHSVFQTTTQSWHIAAVCTTETGRVMTSHETWHSQVFSSHGCCSHRPATWLIHYDCRHTVLRDLLNNCPTSMPICKHNLMNRILNSDLKLLQ